MISGISPFCETFFTDVKVPKHRIFGEENRGWDVAKYLLTHEPEMISGGGAGLSGGGRALGAANTASSQSWCMPRHRAKEFLKFLRQIDKAMPTRRDASGA